MMTDACKMHKVCYLVTAIHNPGAGLPPVVISVEKGFKGTTEAYALSARRSVETIRSSGVTPVGGVSDHLPVQMAALDASSAKSPFYQAKGWLWKGCYAHVAGLVLGDARRESANIDGWCKAIEAAAKSVNSKAVRALLEKAGIPLCPIIVKTRWLRCAETCMWFVKHGQAAAIAIGEAMADGVRILSRKELQGLREAQRCCPQYLAVFGSVDDSVANLEGNTATAGDELPSARRALLLAREHSHELGLDAEVEVVAVAWSRRLLSGPSGRLRVLASAFTRVGRADLRAASVISDPSGGARSILGMEMIDVPGETQRYPHICEPPFEAAGAASRAFRASMQYQTDVDAFAELLSIRDRSGDELRVLPQTIVDVTDANGAEERAEHDSVLEALALGDLLTVHEAVSGDCPDDPPGQQLNEDAEAEEGGGKEDAPDDLEHGHPAGASPTQHGRPAGAEAAFGSTIETIRPAEYIKIVLETLQEIAGPEGSQALPILPAFQAWLAHPLSEQDVRYFGGTHAQLWDALLTAHAVLRPIAPIAKALLALPATEAHCERVIAALRRMICPFSFNMCEETILARLAARGQ
jgi:hypothetical protein